MSVLGFPLDLGGAELVLVDEQDADELHAVVAASRADLRPWLPWAADATADSMRAYLRDARRRREAGEGFECGIREGGRIVGAVGIHHVDLRDRRAEVGYWLAPHARRRGLATRAVVAATERAFGLGLHRVELRVWPGNAASRRLAARAGFVREGVLREAGWHPDGFRDLEVWSRLAP